jgi:hypothetical protein
MGTERRPYHEPRLSGGLGAVVAGAGDLLGAASALWAWRQAGLLPPAVPPAFDPAPGTAAPPAGAGAEPARPGPPARPDLRPLLPAGPLRSLDAIVGEPSLRPLLGEWLQLAAADGRRLPPEWLPDLLDLTERRSRPDLESAGGPRVRWLTRQRPEWSAGGASPVAAGLAAAELAGGRPEWDGSDEDRLAAFAVVRAADPDAGRRLAERIWATEPNSTRAAIVAGLAEGLSDADEPFLEARLDDRRKEVRLAAASMLAGLPDSRLAARMAARVVPLVRRSGRRALVVDPPPSDLDPAARRDGLSPPPASSRAGRPTRPTRSSRPRREDATGSPTHVDRWLLEVAGATPLSAWPEPDELVDAAVRSGAAWLLAAWSLAAERQKDDGWARRLLLAGARPTVGLLQLLGPEEAERYLVDWLRRTPLGTAAGLLGDLPGPWTAGLTDAVMAAVASLVASDDQSPGAVAVRDALPRLARSVDPTRLAVAAAPAAALEGRPDSRRPGGQLFWGRSLASLNAVVHFRHAMHQEFGIR